jgi:hypothetical protein
MSGRFETFLQRGNNTLLHTITTYVPNDTLTLYPSECQEQQSLYQAEYARILYIRIEPNVQRTLCDKIYNGTTKKDQQYYNLLCCVQDFHTNQRIGSYRYADGFICIDSNCYSYVIHISTKPFEVITNHIYEKGVSYVYNKHTCRYEALEKIDSSVVTIFRYQEFIALSTHVFETV